MSMHVHRLAGCTPTPLAHYLKALAVLRLVSTVDPTARGMWRGQVFNLVTTLDRQQLCDFFLHNYCPTPMVSPWNGGSGFYPKDNKSGIDPVANSTCPRLADYRRAIALGRSLVGTAATAPKKDDKYQLLRNVRQAAPPRLRAFFDAAVVLTGDGEPRYPAILGTGGNDGRLDFTNNFMARLVDLFDMQQSPMAPNPWAAAHLESALFGAPTPQLLGSSVGQFLPGNAGGANASSSGFDGPSQINPWDFVLMLEGTLSLRSSVVRRSSVREAPQAAASFAVRSEASGFASATEGDKTRGEQWFPLWENPCTINEVHQLFAEGRCQQGRGFAGKPLEFARSIARLGVCRGVAAFERYGYIERNGQANLATPLGRFTVLSNRAVPFQHLLDEVAPWVERLRQIASDNHAPASFKAAARHCDEALLACCRPGDTPRAFATLLCGLGEAEALALRSPKFAAKKRLRPIPRLSLQWLDAAHIERTCEGRLALSLANLHGCKSSKYADPDDPIRGHWYALVHQGKYCTFKVQSEEIHRGPHQVCVGRNLAADMTSVLKRRLVCRDAGGTSLGLKPLGGYAAPLADIAAFVAGTTDDATILGLCRPLFALDFNELCGREQVKQSSSANVQPTAKVQVDPAFALLRLAHPLAPTVDPTSPLDRITLDPSCLHRLLAGDLSGAARVAKNRLQIAGRLRVQTIMGSRAQAHRLAASLLFPIRFGDRFALQKRVFKPTHNPEQPVR